MYPPTNEKTDQASAPLNSYSSSTPCPFLNVLQQRCEKEGEPLLV